MIKKFDRGESAAIFTSTLDDLDNLNTRDGKFDYSDYVTLHNDFTALYDSFSHVDEIIDGLRQQLAASERREKAVVEDLKQSEHDNGKCDYCRHRTRDGGCASIPVPYSFCSKVNRWEWRGAEKGAVR